MSGVPHGASGARRIVACLVVALALTACGAGQAPQTAGQEAAVDGASGDAGDIALRNIQIPFPPGPSGRYPVGSSAPVLGVIVNEGTGDDELVAVTSPVAAQVAVSGVTRIPPGWNVVCDVATEPPPSPLVVGTVQIVLTTSDVLRAGMDTPVTFRFRNGGKVTLQVPMAEPPPTRP